MHEIILVIINFQCKFFVLLKTEFHNHSNCSSGIDVCKLPSVLGNQFGINQVKNYSLSTIKICYRQFSSLLI